jgi:hypothetical protein
MFGHIGNMGAIMPSAILSFFLTPEEQYVWLRNWLESEKIWVVESRLRAAPRYWPPKQYPFESLCFEEEKRERGEPYFTLYAGHVDLCPMPMWDVRPNSRRGQTLNFAKSQAIHIGPAFRVGNVLLEGQIGILRPQLYAEALIDPAPIQKWWRQSRNMLSSLCVPRARLVDIGTQSPAGINPVISSGAITWRRHGKKLKQFVRGAFEFDVVTS